MSVCCGDYLFDSMVAPALFPPSFPLPLVMFAGVGEVEGPFEQIVVTQWKSLSWLIIWCPSSKALETHSSRKNGTIQGTKIDNSWWQSARLLRAPPRQDLLLPPPSSSFQQAILWYNSINKIDNSWW